MGGDRDGNPFVTSKITQQVLYFARWKAADLFLNDIKSLADELSMVKCTPEFTEKYGEHLEPYRFVVKALRAKLIATLDYFDDCLANRPPRVSQADIIKKQQKEERRPKVEKESTEIADKENTGREIKAEKKKRHFIF